jgi:serine/threonine protein kinase/tetratricopeptide (TPR) repeat protein
MKITTRNPKDIFLDLIRNVPPSEWDVPLKEACGDDAGLLRRVEGLLDAHVRAGSFLDEPAVAGDVTVPVRSETTGSRVGPYKLLEAIGEGGMGTVYMAEQTEPVRRRVALRVIKPGMDTEQVIARFEAERQALALMDHPNIAKVLDAGATESGRPYFVMELVRGIPITDYCDREQLSITDRLELFVLVCRAVQHAHQKGVIHRDLKPSNVMVTVIDGAAIPKVIDFGVAKAIGTTLTERTLHTGFHQFVGTPLYTSPEQADLSGVDVDTRSDIYALGVLLYELLTGTTPFDPETFRQAAFDEMRRMIREDDPPKPSTRLSSLGATRTTVSANRKSDARHLDRAVRGELDWIVMKALEKDRRRRYETANDFASDVMRYLTDKPVEACPPSAFYRFTKYARRNRVALTTATLVGLALVAGTVVSAWQAVRATRAGTLARRKESEARNAAAESKAVLEFLVNDLLEATEPEKAMGQDVKVSEVLANAEKKIDAAFADQPLVEAGVRHALAVAFHGLGRYADALRHVSRAHDLRLTLLGSEHSDTMSSADEIVDLLNHLGKSEEARELDKRTLERRRLVLGPEHPATLKANINLAVTLNAQGEPAEARELLQQVLELQSRTLGPEHPSTLSTMTRLADVLNEQGEHDKAFKLLVQTVDVRQRVLGPEDPRTLDSVESVARHLGSVHKHDEARKIFEQTLEIRRRILPPEHPGTLAVMGDLAIELAELNRLEETRQLFQQILEIRRRTLPLEHPRTLGTMHNLGKVLADLGRNEEARAFYEQTLEIRRRKLGEENRWTLASMQGLARVLHNQGKHDAARRLIERTLESQLRVLGPNRVETWDSMMNLAQWLLEPRDAPENDRARALELARQGAGLEGTAGWWQWLGAAECRNGHWDAAIQAANRSIELKDEEGDAFDFLVLCVAHARRGEMDQAREWYTKARPEMEKEKTSHTPRWLSDEAAALLGVKPSKVEAKPRAAPASTSSRK